MQKVLAVAATMAVGMALISCSETPAVYSPTTSRMVYEPPAQIERAPLPPPLAYASATNKTPLPGHYLAIPPMMMGQNQRRPPASGAHHRVGLLLRDRTAS